MFQIPQARGVLVHEALEDDRIHEPPIDATSFYSKVLSVGVGVPIHPFLISVLKSYGIALAQINPTWWEFYSCGMTLVLGCPALMCGIIYTNSTLSETTLISITLRDGQ